MNIGLILLGPVQREEEEDYVEYTFQLALGVPGESCLADVISAGLEAMLHTVRRCMQTNADAAGLPCEIFDEPFAFVARVSEAWPACADAFRASMLDTAGSA